MGVKALLVLSLTVLFVWENYAQGNGQGLIVTEIMYDPKGTDTGKSDWIELYNPNDLPIVLGKSTFGLIDETEEHDLLTGKLKNTCHTMPDASVTIESSEHIIIADNKNDFLSSYPGYNGKVIDSTLELLSSGDTIKISFDRCKTWTSELSYDDSWGAKSNGKTLELIDNERGYTQDNWQESLVDGGTPGTKNSEDQEEPLPPPIQDEKKNCLNVKLNEIFPFTENEFVEVFNGEDHACDISSWRIEDSSEHKKVFPADAVIESGAHYIMEGKLYFNDDEDTVYLFYGNGIKIDEVQYFANSKQKEDQHSYSLSEYDWMWTAKKTPGDENEIVSDESSFDPVPTPDSTSVGESEKKIYQTGIKITELFPNPFKSEYEEYVELYNSTIEDIDLRGWILRDASKNGKYVFPGDIIIKARGYLAIFKKDFKFALNNSGDESVTLFDPNGKEVAKTEYDGSKRNVSYNFDGSRWRWSKFLTPGEENILNNEPYGTLKIEKDVFKNIYADFSISTGDADGDKIKVTWDFGDNHKSYLVKTRHKYEKTGTYQASVKLSDGSEDIVKNFTVEVKKYPHPEVRIIAVNANPEGSDSILETITIENKSKKKINLKGWSIATGSKSLTNHPITKSLTLKKNETKEISREISKFSLNNKKGKIELRYPDGKVSSDIKYDHGKTSIEENEIYQKVKGGWEWVGAQKSSVNGHQSSENSNATLVIENAEIIEDMKDDIADDAVLGVEFIKIENKLLIISNENVKIELLKSQPRVLGAETVREIDGVYFLTPEAKQEEHYAISFLKNISSNINTKLNFLLNYFFKQ